MAHNARANLKAAMARGMMGACALVLAVGLGGCTLTLPPRSEVPAQEPADTLPAGALLQEGVLTVALDTADAPQAMNDANGQPTGYYVDLARALAQRFGVKVQFVSAASPHSSLDEGEADVYLGARAANASETINVFGSVGQDASAVFAKGAEQEGGRAVRLTVEDLNAAAIAVQDSSAAQDALTRAGISGSVKTYPNVNKCFDALAAGEVSYVACDVTAGAYLARAQADVSFAGIIGSPSTFGVATSAGNTELAAAIESALQSFTSDGTLDALRATWYGDVPSDLTEAALSGVTVDTSGASASNGSSSAGASMPEGDAAIANGGVITGDINSLG